MLTRRLLANIFGTAWSAVVMVAIVPLYIRYLGVAAYGVIGFYVALLAVVVVIDFGLGTAVNRSFAAAATIQDRRSAFDLASTVHAVFWLLALFFALVLGFLAAPIAKGFATPQIPVGELVIAMRIMAVAVGLQFPFTFYAAALLGLQRHVEYNIVAFGLGATFRALLTILALILVRPSLEVFFAAQVVGNGLQTGLVAWLFFRQATTDQSLISLSPEPLRRIWRFAAGASAITLLPILLAQVDKFVLSQVIPLDEFGLYAIATTAAAGFGFLASPYFVTLFPRSTEMIRSNDYPGLFREYRHASQLLACTVFPPLAVLVIFAVQVVAAWTGNDVMAQHVAPILQPLAIAYALSAVLALPNALILAGGETHHAAWINILGVACLVPVIGVLGALGGATMAAYGRVGVSLGIAVGTFLVARGSYLREERAGELIRDVAAPLLVSFFAASAAHVFLQTPSGRVPAALFLMAVAVVTFSFAVLTTPQPRAQLWRFGKRLIGG